MARVGAEETELVGGGEAGGEEEPERPGGARGALDNVVFFWTKVSAAEVARGGGREGFENGEAKDGPKEARAKGPAGLIALVTSSKIAYEGRTLSPR